MSITYEQFIAHILSDAEFKSFLERLCREKEYIDDHRIHIVPNGNPCKLTHVLLVAPVDTDWALVPIEPDNHPWVSSTYTSQTQETEVYTPPGWRHTKNPLVANADGKIHVTTCARGSILRKIPLMNSVYIDPEDKGYEAEACMIMSIENLQQVLSR